MIHTSEHTSIHDTGVYLKETIHRKFNKINKSKYINKQVSKSNVIYICC